MVSMSVPALQNLLIRGFLIMEINSVARLFFEKKFISTEMDLNEYILQAAEIVELADAEVTRLAEDNLDRLKDEVVWSVLHDMYKKCYEFTSGALALFVIGQFGAAEALCRTAVESSVNVYYASCGDEVGNVIAYFRTYISNERSQNKNWLNSVEQSKYSESEKAYHRDLISSKEHSLNMYEGALRASFSMSGVNYDLNSGSWPSIFDRFSKIGKEVEYRTVYAGLCSQAHNDPEDVLNDLMARIIDVEGLEQSTEIQRYIYSLNMVLTSVLFYVESSTMYLAKFGVDAKGGMMPLFGKIVSLMEKLQSGSKEKIIGPLRNGNEVAS